MKTEQILRQWKDAGYAVPLLDGPRFALWDLADGIADYFRREGNALFAEGKGIEVPMQAQLIAGVLAKLCREGVIQDFKKALDEQNGSECRRLMAFAYRDEAKDFSEMEPSDVFSPSAGLKADIPYRYRIGRPWGSSERDVRGKMALLEKIKTVRLTKGGEVVMENAAELAARIQSGIDMKAAIFGDYSPSNSSNWARLLASSVTTRMSPGFTRPQRAFGEDISLRRTGSPSALSILMPSARMLAAALPSRSW